MSSIPLAVKRRIIDADVRIRELEQQLAARDAQSVRDAWISVDERLPEQHEWVLVSDGTWSAIGTHRDDEDLEPNKRWMDESAELIESNGIKITHWQPLPAPPQKPVSDEVKP